MINASTKRGQTKWATSRSGQLAGRGPCLRFLGLVMGFVAGQIGLAAEQQPNNAVDFERQVQPILQDHCISCHGPEKQEAGLRLDQQSAALRGGDSGQIIVSGKPRKSLLVERVLTDDPDLRMPLGKPALTTTQVGLLSDWIAAGADWPDQLSGEDPARTNHWSFQPLQRPQVPVSANWSWPANAIDYFVLKRLETAGMQPSSEAERRTQIRRLFLDLTGLPPAAGNLHKFLTDRRPDAWERLVDRLLASPHVGERWGQHWLDLARYADSDGYEMDYFRPHAWRWRDWVLRSVNQDMPFDQFTLEQLAGDLLGNATVDQIVATGFHRNALTNTENGIDAEEFRVKAIVDRVNTTGTVWLGLTVGCAECHSHKYDPIAQREYYGLFAFFNNRVDEASVVVPPTRFDLERLDAATRKYNDEIRPLQRQLEQAAAADRQPIEKELRKLRDALSKLKPVAAAFGGRDQPRTTHLHIRGNFLDRGPVVAASTPAVLTHWPVSTGPVSTGADRIADRLDLARWIVSDDNPLTARVEANRIWQHLFGKGLVRTPEDFGKQGQPPTHPQLLDWLASELRQQNWSRKRLIRLIVTSAAYRQSANIQVKAAELDPDNRLVWRQNRLRLDAETLRDQYLAASGLLSRQIGGPSFHPALPRGLAKIGFRLAWETGTPDQQRRRGMYVVTRRNLAVPMLTAFDRPDANVTCTRRESSNTPMQSLTQMNDPLFVDAARALAIGVIKEPPRDFATRLDRLFEKCLARPPTAQEQRTFARLLERVAQIYRRDPAAADALVRTGEKSVIASWTIVARTVMNLDEFITRE